MDEKLRLVLELQNKASAELKKFGKDLEGVKPGAGAKATANWFQMLESASGDATKALRPMTGALNTVGLSSLAAGLSVTGLITQFRDLAKTVPQLQELSRQTGMTKTQIERLKYAAKDLNIDPSKMTASLDYFSGQMVQFHRRTGTLYAEMQNGASGLVEKIRTEEPGDAYRDMLKWLAAIPEAQVKAGKSAADAAQIQKYWIGQALGDEGLSPLLGKGMAGFDHAMDNAKKNVGEITDDLISQANKLNESINAFDQSWHNFETTVGPTVFKNLTAATEDFRQVFKTVEDAAAWYEKAKDHPVQAAADAAKSAIDAQAEHNKAHPEGIILDLPGAVSDVIHNAIGDRRPIAQPWDENIGLPGVDTPVESRPTALRQPVPVPTVFRVPDAYNREQRARRPNDLDGFVVGELGKEVIHLTGTLRSASGTIADNIHPAAFHGGSTGLTGVDPGSVIEAAVKAGTLSAFREWAGMQDLDKAGGGGGFTPTAFHMGGVPGGRSASAAGRAPSLRYGRQHDGAPYDDGGGATPTGAHTPLKDLIAAHETGGIGAAGYDTVYGHAEQPGSKMAAFAPPKPVTQMTISEILAYQRDMKARAHSEAFPVGRAQWVERTLRTITHGMDPNTVFTPEVQEKLFDRSIAGRMGQGVGGFQSEWDSLRHVDAGTIQSAIEGHRAAMAKAAPVASSGPRGAYPDWMDDRSRREMAGINGPLARDLITASAETGAHFRILQGLRTQDEANANARKGMGVRNSQHLYGAAADLKLTGADGRDLDRNDPAYDRYATAFERISRAHGGGGRWLGHVPGWAWDRAHFDQGVGYGQSHQRDPYGAGGPTAADVAAGNREIFSGPDNPFLRAAKPMSDAADKLRAAVAPMPAIAPEPPRLDATAGQRAQIDPIELNIRHHPSGRTSVAAKSGPGVKINLQTAPTMTRVA